MLDSRLHIQQAAVLVATLALSLLGYDYRGVSRTVALYSDTRSCVAWKIWIF